jgi:hypothetical protein
MASSIRPAIIEKKLDDIRESMLTYKFAAVRGKIAVQAKNHRARADRKIHDRLKRQDRRQRRQPDGEGDISTRARLASSDCSGASHRGPASSHAQQLVVVWLSYCGIKLFVIHAAAVPRGCGSTWCAIADRKAAISRAIATTTTVSRRFWPGDANTERTGLSAPSRQIGNPNLG